MGPHKITVFLYGKGHHQKDKLATNKLGKDLPQPYIRERANIQYIQRTQEVRAQKTK